MNLFMLRDASLIIRWIQYMPSITRAAPHLAQNMHPHPWTAVDKTICSSPRISHPTAARSPPVRRQTSESAIGLGTAPPCGPRNTQPTPLRPLGYPRTALKMNGSPRSKQASRLFAKDLADDIVGSVCNPSGPTGVHESMPCTGAGLVYRRATALSLSR